MQFCKNPAERTAVRKLLWEAQGKKCVICMKSVPWGDTILEHRHSMSNGNGPVTGVAHRGCNGAEGKVLRALRWMKGSEDPVLKIQKIQEFWKTHGQGSPLLEQPILYKKP